LPPKSQGANLPFEPFGEVAKVDDRKRVVLPKEALKAAGWDDLPYSTVLVGEVLALGHVRLHRMDQKLPELEGRLESISTEGATTKVDALRIQQGRLREVAREKGNRIVLRESLLLSLELHPDDCLREDHVPFLYVEGGKFGVDIMSLTFWHNRISRHTRSSVLEE